jgi:hypothetical protein
MNIKAEPLDFLNNNNNNKRKNVELNHIASKKTNNANNNDDEDPTTTIELSLTASVSSSLNSNFALKFLNNLKLSYQFDCNNDQLQPHDLCIILNENEKLYAHKLIILNSSNYLRQKIVDNLEKPLVENMACINLRNENNECFNFESVKTCLAYIYSFGIEEKILVKKSNLFKLASTARKFELDDLYSSIVKQFPLLNVDFTNNSHFIFNAYLGILRQSELFNLKIHEENSNRFDKIDEFMSQLDIRNSRIEIDTISRDFFVKDKYIYPSKIANALQDLKQYLENFSTFLNPSTSSPNRPLNNNINEEFDRCSLVIFCLHMNNNHKEIGCLKFDNLVLSTRLKFTDLEELKSDLEIYLNEFLCDFFRLNKKNNQEQQQQDNVKLKAVLNRVCYLKKPSNCRTIRLETIKSSTDCFRAIVEYSRVNHYNNGFCGSSKELPYVLLTAHASVKIITK